MVILQNLSNQLKKDNIILKDSNKDKLAKVNQKIVKENIIEEKEEFQLSLIKENSDNSINEGINLDKNNMEISIVQLDKLEEKEKNIIQIQNLIKSCEVDIQYLDNSIHKYKNCTNDLVMESGIFNEKSLVFINKKESNENIEVDDSERKVKYFEDLKAKFLSLKYKLENLLRLYKTEKNLTEIKKIELEKLDNIKKEFNKLKKNKF